MIILAIEFKTIRTSSIIYLTIYFSTNGCELKQWIIYSDILSEVSRFWTSGQQSCKKRWRTFFWRELHLTVLATHCKSWWAVLRGFVVSFLIPHLRFTFLTNFGWWSKIHITGPQIWNIARWRKRLNLWEN